jgi:hypothetical protein
MLRSIPTGHNFFAGDWFRLLPSLSAAFPHSRFVLAYLRILKDIDCCRAAR